MTKTRLLLLLAVPVVALFVWKAPAAVERYRKDAIASEAKVNLAGIFTAMKADFGEY